jgi:hypothetical protein
MAQAQMAQAQMAQAQMAQAQMAQAQMAQAQMAQAQMAQIAPMDQTPTNTDKDTMAGDRVKMPPKEDAIAAAEGTVPANAVQQAALYAKQQAQLAKMTPQQQAQHAAQQAKIQHHSNALLHQFQALQNDTSVRASAFISHPTSYCAPPLCAPARRLRSLESTRSTKK